MYECANPKCRKPTDADYCSEACCEAVEGPLGTPVLPDGGVESGVIVDERCAADEFIDALWAFGK